RLEPRRRERVRALGPVMQMAYYSLDTHARREMTQCHPDIDAASVLNLGDETVRVFSDGVPERDYPEGCQLLVLCTRKLIGRHPKKQGQSPARPQTHRGKQ